MADCPEDVLAQLREELADYASRFSDTQLCRYFNTGGSFEGAMRKAIRWLIGKYSSHVDSTVGEFSEKRAQELAHLQKWYELYGAGEDTAAKRAGVSFWRAGHATSPAQVSRRSAAQ